MITIRWVAESQGFTQSEALTMYQINPSDE